MTPPARFFHRAWLVVCVAACAYAAWAAQVRRERVDYVSGLQGRANPVDALDGSSPTGYANGQRELIIPERNEESFQWISQAQRMLARRELRVRHVDYENAPFGHDVSLPSPYRWWLGLLAVADHEVSGRPAGLSVERAAIYADPLLQAVFLIGAAAVAWLCFGAFAAALVCAGITALFPLAAVFLPGMPAQQGLADILACAGLLAVAAGSLPGARARSWFVAGGIAGGLGLWVSVPTLVPLLIGILAGGLVFAGVAGLGAEGAGLPWRAWSVSGAITVFVAFLLENFPGQTASLRMDLINPAYGLAWLGAGELLARTAEGLRGARPAWGPRGLAAGAVAALCVASVPIATRISAGPGFLGAGQWERLTWLPGGPIAPNSWAWLAQGGASLTSFAALVPMLALVPALWTLLGSPVAPRLRACVGLALGPVAVALGMAAFRPVWWGAFDVSVLVLLAACAAAAQASAKPSLGWMLAAAALAFAAPGVARTLPPAAGPSTELTPMESEELVERHLAHWLARRTGAPGFVVYAPPYETTTLCFFGGLRGVGTFAPDNHEGFGSALTIAGAQTMEDEQADLEGRGVRYIVMPSWDPFFDDFARLYLRKDFAGRTSLLARELRAWNLPPWLQPVPYQLPVGGGFKGQSVLVYEVVEPQSPAAAQGRIAEYLVEMGDLDAAAASAERLRRFPGDVGALAAEAQVEAARGDAGALSSTMASLLGRLSNGGDRYLAWDRRVSLAVVLARAERYDLASAEIRKCAAEASEERIRSLSTGSLYDFLVLAHSFQAAMDPGLRDLAVELLPVDLRGRI